MAMIGELILAETAFPYTKYVGGLVTRIAITLQAFARNLSRCFTRKRQEAFRALGIEPRKQELGPRTACLW